ncbi:UV-stimulated scaffold protein A-like isoform X2 [Lineus longissimus]|uniref:UV-stimulated scaffold protein A-like isoform X2 n=1 Tax=Lineus longissimus TaxID=88925 RepID=UPI00315D7673
MSEEEAALDHGLCQEMAKYVEELTTSGSQTLDEGIMKSLKKICKVSDGYVKHLHHLVMSQLEKEHAEIRFSAFQIANEIFVRSHQFRELILSDFHNFLELTAEIDFDCPLPPPKHAAKNLNRLAIQAVQKWYIDFGHAYKKLALGYNFLKNFKKVEFNDASAQNVMERRVAEERDRRRCEFMTKKLDTLRKEMDENCTEILACVTQLESGIDLILPNPDFEIDWDKIYSSANEVPRWEPVVSSASVMPCDENTDTNDLTPTCSGVGDNHDKEPDKDSTSAGVGEHVPELLAKCDDCNSKNETLGQNEGHSPTRKNPDTCEKTHSSFLGKRGPDIDADTTGKKSRKEKNQSVDSESQNDNSDGKVSKSHQGSADNQVGNIDIFDKFKLPFPIAKSSKSGGKNSRLVGLTEAEINMDTFSGGNEAVKSDSGTSCTSDDSDYDDFEEVSDIASMISKTGSAFIREHGFGTWRYNLNIDVTPEIIEDDNNTDIIQNLVDAQRLIDTKFGPMVSRWLEILTKFGGHQDQVREVLELRKRVTTTRDKYEFVSKRIEFRPRKSVEEPEQSTSKGSRPSQYAGKTASQWQIQSRPSHVECSSDPTTVEATLNVLKKKIHTETITTPTSFPKPLSSTADIDPKKAEMLKRAPKVQFDTDLSYWGKSEKEIKPPTVVKFDSLHVFWQSENTGSEFVTANTLEAMTSRKIDFTGRYQPVKWACRAPMPNGKLCERRDRLKCPFHGKIVQRDEKGLEIKPEDAVATASSGAGTSAGGEEVPDWQDPELLRDIEAAKGVDLGSGKGKGKAKGKGKGKKKEKYPGLTNLKQTQNTARNRLEKRVLSRRALKKVASDLDKIDERKFKDKFCNQFNYHFKK